MILLIRLDDDHALTQVDRDLTRDELQMIDDGNLIAIGLDGERFTEYDAAGDQTEIPLHS